MIDNDDALPVPTLRDRDGIVIVPLYDEDAPRAADALRIPRRSAHAIPSWGRGRGGGLEPNVIVVLPATTPQLSPPGPRSRRREIVPFVRWKHRCDGAYDAQYGEDTSSSLLYLTLECLGVSSVRTVCNGEWKRNMQCVHFSPSLTRHGRILLETEMPSNIFKNRSATRRRIWSHRI